MDLLPQLGRVVFAFAIVMGLMLGISWLVRRFKLDQKWQGRGRHGTTLSIEDSLFLDAKRRLVVIGHAGARYLLLLGPTGDTLIAAREAPVKEE